MEVALKQRLVAAARAVGVVPALETIRFARAAAASRKSNNRYLKENPEFAPPPLWWMHDMYSHASYALYAKSGEETAAAIAQYIDRYFEAETVRVADWGCGLGRMVRSLPARYRRTGFDYNARAIDWCQRNIQGVEFSTCTLSPPLPRPAKSFDAVCALSVFTHLSEEGHRNWIAEISRVLAPGGLLFATLHMTPGAGQLLPHERKQFDSGNLVVRGMVKEGGRTYTAFHPDAYVRQKLLAGFELLEEPAAFFGQRLICARKK